MLDDSYDHENNGDDLEAEAGPGSGSSPNPDDEGRADLTPMDAGSADATPGPESSGGFYDRPGLGEWLTASRQIGDGARPHPADSRGERAVKQMVRYGTVTGAVVLCGSLGGAVARELIL